MPVATLLYVSAQPTSVGHTYRVTNHAERLRELGYRVLVMPPEGATAAIRALPRLRAVIVFRPVLDQAFQEWRQISRQRDLPLLVDLDDLTFDPALLEGGGWSYWRGLDHAQRQSWRQRVEAQRQALLASDGAIVSTSVLAGEVRQLGRPAWIWPNGFGDLSWATAAAARRRRQEAPQDPIVIGYASGTPTHANDFGEIALALAEILRRHAAVQLHVVGALDLQRWSCLQEFSERLVNRPLVPYPQLPAEVSRFSINLAPLEINSRFCQAKSELKFFEAAAVGVPSVVTATQPFAAVVQHRGNGCLARSAAEWVSALDWLVTDSDARRRLARRAWRTVRRRFSPGAQRRDLRQLIEQGLFPASPS